MLPDRRVPRTSGRKRFKLRFRDHVRYRELCQSAERGRNGRFGDVRTSRAAPAARRARNVSPIFSFTIPSLTRLMLRRVPAESLCHPYSKIKQRFYLRRSGHPDFFPSLTARRPLIGPAERLLGLHILPAMCADEELERFEQRPPVHSSHRLRPGHPDRWGLSRSRATRRSPK